MLAYLKHFVIGCLLIGAASCIFFKDDPPNISAVSCESDTSKCLGTDTPVCNTGIEPAVCVQCLSGTNTDACTGNTPVCGTDNTCGACVAHTDCTSNACLPAGGCAAEGEVVYLKAGGSGAGGVNCTKDAPCGNLITAIGQAKNGTRPYIRVIGTIEDSNVDISGKVLTFLGEAGAVLRGDQSSGIGDSPILDLSNGAKVEIYDLTLRDARREGLRVDSNGATLLIERSKILNIGYAGVSISNGGKVTISQSEISSCGNSTGGGGPHRGVNVIQGEVTITRSMLSDNGGGVLIADNQKFQISNSFIVGSRDLGGIRAPIPGANSKLEFNTIVDNQDDGGGTLNAGGVSCDLPTFTFPNNIIFRNTGGASGFAQTAGACKFDGSLVSSNTAMETRTLGFVKDTAPREYHLTPGSPTIVKDVATATCTGLVDYDGDTRPQGNACDLGADEVK